MNKRSLILFLALLMAALMLISCSSKDEEAALQEAETEALPENVDPADYYGCWKYKDSTEWICIFEDGNYMVHGGMEELISPTPYMAIPEGLYISKMDIYLYYDENGDLYTSDGLALEPGELVAYDLYIERNLGK